MRSTRALSGITSSAFAPRPPCLRGTCSVVSLSICAPGGPRCSWRHSHGALVRRHRLFMRLRCALRPCPARERVANHDTWPATALAPPQRMCTCSPLTAAIRSTRCCAAPPASPPAPPPSAARSPPPSPPPPAIFRRLDASLRCCRCCRGSLPGGLELQGGVQGGSDGAAAQYLSSGGSGGPPARLRRLWRRRAARLLAAGCVHHVCKKVLSVAAYFSGCVHVCACPMRVSDAPNSPLHEGMRGVARM